MYIFNTFFVKIFFMEIKLYNTLSRKVEVFKPIKENEVSLYVCGPTVYNDPHIGNMRPVVFFDTMRKFFEAIGYKVNYVSNYTDVDDKIINKALSEGVNEKVISERYIAAYEKCLNDLHVKKATLNPKVTEYIPQIISYIDNLVINNKAYISDGEVFFDVNKVSDYGCLSNIDMENLKTNARIGLNEKKHNQFDFVLWKKTTDGIKWESPFETGRPGWHTECCVMIDSIFNGMIDIHGGGSDLKFPHHENEIAQTMATHNNHLAKYWIHTAMMNISGEKMSKSLGNVILTKDAIAQYGANVIRLLLLNSHYRNIINFTEEVVKDTTSIINKLENCYKQLNLKIQKNNGVLEGYSSKINDFFEYLADDFNIPNCVTYMLDIVKEANVLLRKKDTTIEEIQDIYYCLNQMLYILGIQFEVKILSSEDKELFKKYDEAKSNKDFATSDLIREELIKRNLF